jgi:RHS repeat-associated protein
LNFGSNKNRLIGITDRDDILLCKNSYSSCGIVSITMDTGGIGALNPIRYKGYYYDNERQLYCISNIYYSPTLAIFIQPIDISNLNTSNINGLNLYSYVSNNPIVFFINKESKIECVSNLFTTFISENSSYIFKKILFYELAILFLLEQKNESKEITKDIIEEGNIEIENNKINIDKETEESIKVVLENTPKIASGVFNTLYSHNSFPVNVAKSYSYIPKYTNPLISSPSNDLYLYSGGNAGVSYIQKDLVDILLEINIW